MHASQAILIRGSTERKFDFVLTLRRPIGDPIDDPRACYLRNEAPSYEDRLILIALSSSRRLLLVVHAEVGRDAIRIISARKASPAQRRIYEEELD